jgi:hypothetical protein
MSMNIFRCAGDFSHLMGILILLYRLTVGKNAGGTGRRRVCVGATSVVGCLSLTLFWSMVALYLHL